MLSSTCESRSRIIHLSLGVLAEGGNLVLEVFLVKLLEQSLSAAKYAIKENIQHLRLADGHLLNC